MKRSTDKTNSNRCARALRGAFKLVLVSAFAICCFSVANAQDPTVGTGNDDDDGIGGGFVCPIEPDGGIDFDNCRLGSPETDPPDDPSPEPPEPPEPSDPIGPLGIRESIAESSV